MNWLNRFFYTLQKTDVYAECPVCKKSAKQPASKQQRGQAMLCPYCKSLFILKVT